MSTETQYAEERIHLLHELDQLRGRMVRLLTDSADMLEVGLSALRKGTPRVPVMAERAEVVLRMLQEEIDVLMNK